MPETQTLPEGASLTGLVSGIIEDTQQLLKQQVALIRSEIKQDLKTTTDAAKYLGIGAGVAAAGGLMLVFALVYLLKWLFPALDESACYAIVGGALLAIGAVLIYGGLRLFKANNPLPDQSVQALQENVQWLKNIPR
jgi:high-affinity Fe2+/Pb2+ permease